MLIPKHMDIDIKALLFNSLQFRYNKHIRTKYNITTPHLQVLSSLYYLTITNPPNKMRVKHGLRQLNPQMVHKALFKHVGRLVTAGLVEYDKGDGAYNYNLELTSLGVEVIESLFTVGKVEGFLNSKVKGLSL